MLKRAKKEKYILFYLRGQMNFIGKSDNLFSGIIYVEHLHDEYKRDKDIFNHQTDVILVILNLRKNRLKSTFT